MKNYEAKTKSMNSITVHASQYLDVRKAQEGNIIYIEICYHNTDVGLRYWSIEEHKTDTIAEDIQEAYQFCDGYEQAMRDAKTN